MLDAKSAWKGIQAPSSAQDHRDFDKCEIVRVVTLRRDTEGAERNLPHVCQLSCQKEETFGRVFRRGWRSGDPRRTSIEGMTAVNS